MGLFKQNLRRWWQHPGQIGDRSIHRTVTFLELFYDLVYVVLIAQIGHGLAAHIDLLHLGQYFFLFIIVWWSWFNGMSYHDLHGNNDIRTRVFTFAQMICVVAMAAFVHGALGETSIPFALSYAAFQLILTFLWWRVGVYHREHRRLSNPYSMGFLLAALLFFISAFVPLSVRPYLWGASVIISLLLPFFMIGRGRHDQEVQKELDKLVIVSPSMVERFGLFTIIVLGEVVVGVVLGLSEQHHLTWHIGISALLGIVIAVGIWWIYFDFVSHRIPKATMTSVIGWRYLHLPLAAAISAVGGALLNVIQGAEEALLIEVRWLLLGSVATMLLCIGLLIPTIQVNPAHQHIYKTGSRIMLLSAPLVILLGLVEIQAIGLLSLVVLVLLVPVYYGLRGWLQAAIEQSSVTGRE